MHLIRSRDFVCFVFEQVDYDNHPLYKHGKTGRKQSPVRIFTNISAKKVVLPKEEGYRYQHTSFQICYFVYKVQFFCGNQCPDLDNCQCFILFDTFQSDLKWRKIMLALACGVAVFFNLFWATAHFFIGKSHKAPTNQKCNTWKLCAL